MFHLPNFRHLYYFWTIAREGSIKKAGIKLNLTPAGLSEQLKLLEKFFNLRLFDRKARRLVLNDTGKLVFEYCTSIFNQLEEMTLAVKQNKPGHKTRIRVGVLPSLSSNHIHEFVLPLLNDTSVTLTVTEGSLDELVYKLDHLELEIVLSDRKVYRKYKRIHSFRLRPQKVVAVGNQKFASLKKQFPHSLSGTPMLQLTRHSQIRDEIDHYLYKHNVIPLIIGEADDVSLLRIGAEKGVCVSILPLNTVQQSLTQGNLIKIGELKGINSDMWAMTRSDSGKLEILQKTIKKFRSRE